MALVAEGPNFERLLASGSTIHRIGARGNHDVSILWAIVRLVRTIRPNLVQTWITQMDVFGGIASRVTGTPFVLSERSCVAAYPPSFKNGLRVRVGRYAAAIVANSNDGRYYWENRARECTPKYVIPNGIPLGDIANVEDASFGVCLPSTSRLVLFAGRFSPEKNIGKIIQAFKIVVHESDSILMLCGDGALRPQIETVIRRENLNDHVLLPGYVRDLWPLMKCAKVFINLSTFEGQPNGVLEAMACSCPLVLSDIPAHRAFLEGDQAFFVELERPSEIAHAILTCIDRPEVAQRMAKKAKARASSFSVQAVTDQYESVYNQILSHSIQERR